MIVLKSDRLILRNLILQDAEVMHDYRNNEVCAKYQRGMTRELNAIRKLIETQKNDQVNDIQPFIFAVELTKTKKMIGEIVVMPSEMTFSIGYTISYKHHRNGYAYEALNILINHLHEQYPLWEFISYTDRDNVPSMNLLTKLGYENLGYIDSIESQAFGKWVKESTLTKETLQ